MRWRIYYILLFLLIFILSGCGSEEVSNESLKTVYITEVTFSQPVRDSQLTGILQPEKEAILSFQVAGQIEQEMMEIGTEAKKGEVLAAISSELYQWQAEAARAQLDEAQAVRQQVESGARAEEIKQAEAVFNQAKASAELARSEYQRMKSLYEAGAISESAFEAVITKLEVSEQQLTQAEEAYQLTLKGARDEQKKQVAAKVNQASSQSKLSQEQLEKTRLTAPFEGVVLEKFASVGELVSPGRAIYRFGYIDHLKVSLPVPSKEIKDWSTGKKVKVVNGTMVKVGEITRVSPATNRGTGTVTVEVVVDNKDRAWLSGETVSVINQIQEEKGIYLNPSAVIQKGEGGPYVFIFEQGQVRKQKVTVKKVVKGDLLVTSGLISGQKVVVQGANFLSDGEKVFGEEVK
ncbi:efflux RND transporter periplasmic adaptor subunit [Microaerobacter geothermalis]|uniref:efflux RND transporter periplasmic adaptor subunit n=1 Tax=Microaerobacter geothermalis TaxID=674972 RepID=UPI001F380B35|nr:efflux RND transporter periplasmic adaptor subunit [Microaerobacter geothermalis]MCF6094871.1 efflux RND transporter periplasmic adaptor subunit [Microaerobacter geothermalis]